MPSLIGPGTGDPLDVHARLVGAGISFHEAAVTHFVGYNASYGCMRLGDEGVIELPRRRGRSHRLRRRRTAPAAVRFAAADGRYVNIRGVTDAEGSGRAAAPFTR